MGLVKTRRLAAMHKQERAKEGMGFARGKGIGFAGDCSGKRGKRG